jgi:hypothetical protein
MIQELPTGDHVFIFTHFVEILLDKNSSSSNSRTVRIFLSKNCSRKQEAFSRVFLYLNHILDLKEFRMFKG